MEPIGGKYPHCEVDALVKIKIGSLEGKVKRPDYEKLMENPIWQYSGFLGHGACADLKVVVQIFADNKPVSLPVSTSYKSFTTRWNWNEWVYLPVRFSDLPQNAQFCITVFDCGGPSDFIPVGGSTISAFGKHGVFRQGMLDLRVWPGQISDSCIPSATPGKGPKDSNLYRLNKIAKKHRMGKLSKLDWLDRLTFSEIETICEREKRESDMMFLNVEFPTVEYGGIQYAIVYSEKLSRDIVGLTKTSDSSIQDSKWLPDHEILLVKNILFIRWDNLVETKHHTLSRCVQTGFSDAELKPNASNRDQLNAIVNYPPTKLLSSEEQDLVWKFRYYLRSNKKALAKFLKCVKWVISGEEKQALELLGKWAPMDVQDALELLGPQFTHSAVRRYAVARLKQAPDDDLLLYLLQLVQALKYENFEQISEEVDHMNFHDKDNRDSLHPASIVSTHPESPHFRDDISRSRSESDLANTLGVKDSLSSKSRNASFKHAGDFMSPVDDENVDLASFLIYRACENTTLANYFYWYLFIECEDHEVGVKQDSHIREMYGNVMKRFIKCLKRGKTEWQLRRDLLSRQQKLINKLVDIVKSVAKENVNRPKKIEKLQTLLGETDVLKMNLTKFDPLPFPLDPEIHIQGVLAKQATLFKSSQMPCKLVFSTTGPEPYTAIFKHGDDLRQDQLVLQIITLMDKLLRKENLDLRLTPYRVLATSTTHGFVQFIPSTTVADVLASEGTIHNFFRKHNPSETAWNGIKTSVMDTYVKSCAGYCVITYLLGVGDRHLDNLLLTTDGKLFHIDFGYILGRDPKPMPPPMKLSKEMVEAMGGINSEYYQEFRKLCYTAFLHLRRHANLILNLFSLMVGASVPDIALEPDKTVKKVLDKFQLDLNDEAAVKYMQECIDVSVTAVMPALLEQMHKFTQMLRK